MSRQAELKVALGPFDAICVVIGAIVGVGIFFSPGQIARTSGSTELALTTWICGALAALLGAWTFAQLGREYPRTGGQYAILQDGFGNFCAGLCVLTNITVIIPGSVAVIALISVQNALPALAGRAATAHEIAVGSHALIWTLAAVNCIGVRWGAGVQNTTVVIKLAVLALVVGCALFVDAPQDAVAGTVAVHEVQFGAVGAVLAGLIPAFFAYGGWQQVLWLGGEVRDARRVLPWAILAGVGVVVLTYLSANWAYFHLLGFEGVAGSKALAADAMQRGLGPFGARLVAAGVTVSALGVLNVQFMAGPRLAFAAARDGRFFAPFAQASTRFRTPLWAILALAACASVLLLIAGSDGLDPLTAWVVVPDAAFMILTALTLPLLLRRRGARLGAFALLCPLLFSAVELGAMVGACLDAQVRSAALLGAAWMTALSVLWWWRFRRPATH